MPCKSIFPEILVWSLSRPEWQRDALRRLILTSIITPKDLQEIESLCKSSHGIKSDASPGLKPQPLKQEHIPCQFSPETPIRMVSISEVKNVNVICSEVPLTFSDTGLTVIYGENGSGKSGYVRILKNLCRAKERPEILPNAFSESSQPPSAKVTYKVGDTEKPFKWQFGKTAPAELNCINIFDANCGSIYVNSENEIAYAPLGLESFDKLVRICEKIKENLTTEMNGLAEKLEILPFEHWEASIGKWYNQINRNTTEQEIDKTDFTEDDKKRLELVNRVLAEGTPKKRAAELRNKKARYDHLAIRMNDIASSLSDEVVQSLEAAKIKLDVATEAAKLASNEAFSKELVKGVGTDAWYELWNAAKKFSEEEAYPGEEFPKIDGRCVLCFQELKGETPQRFKEFKQFVQKDTASKKKDAEKAFSALKLKLSEFEISKDTDTTLFAELETDNQDLSAEIQVFFFLANGRKETISNACNNNKWESVSDLPESPPKTLTALSEQINGEAETLSKLGDPDEYKNLQNESAELSAKKWVSQRRAQIIEEVGRQKLVTKYENAIDDTNTYLITRKNTDLTNKYVTEEVRNKFATILNFLYDGKLNIGWEKKRGEKGVSYFALNLNNCKLPKAKAKDIISEGEFKAVALAEFLTDITLSQASSGIIFDDPVTSLDHKIRDKVAEKIIDLAKRRQVIVFTHDIYLLVNLLDMGKAEGIRMHSEQQLLRVDWGAGVCVKDSPWESANVSKRIGKINALIQEATPKYKEGPTVYELFASNLCIKMRQTVERALEDILICGVVQRYRKNVQITQVKDLTKIDEQDCKLIEHYWDKYSKLLHDHREGNPVTWPSPQDIQIDADKLKAWAKEFPERKKP
jgi:energy-coupling factor transporter ATP-binding protein EcfA2